MGIKLKGLLGRTSSLYGFVLIIFVIKIFDSLYVRQHGDALNYHLYAPYLWAQKGLLYNNLFQAMHFQSAWWEWLVTGFFKLYLPQTMSERENVLILFQVISCAFGFLLFPLAILHYNKKILSLAGLWILLLAFYASEYMFFTVPFAKNDALAALLFFVGAMTPGMTLKTLFLALSVGVKATYLYGVIFYILIFRKKLSMRNGLVIIAVSFFFQGIVWLRNYLATGNPLFPMPSNVGLQTSQWQKEHFLRYMGLSDPYWIGYKFWEMFSHSPLPILIIFLSLFVILYKEKVKDWNIEKLWLLVPFVYLIITGIRLEWRLYSGVTFYAVTSAMHTIDTHWFRKKEQWGLLTRILIFVLIVLGLATSKIDPSSIKRFLDSREKTYKELVRDGETWFLINQLAKPEDIVMTQLTNEGYFLVPLLYTVNEHPQRDEILNYYNVLDDIKNMILIHANGPCQFVGVGDFFIKRLLSQKPENLIQEARNPHVFHLNLDCH